MKKAFCFLMIFLMNHLHAQLRIENIQTDKEALAFIQQIGEKNRIRWGKISFSDKGRYVEKYLNNEQRLFVDSITKDRWFLADFNLDGKKDMVASFSSYSNQYLYAFISDDDLEYRLVSLGNIYSDIFPTGVFLIHEDDKLLLKLMIHQPNGSGEDLSKYYRSDTLVYKVSSFIERKLNYEPEVKFDSIFFKVQPVWMSGRNIPLMKLYNDGTIKLYQGYFVDTIFEKKWEGGIKVCRTPAENVKLIGDVLGLIDYFNLKSNYDIPGVSDLTTYITEVYSCGKRKTIKDYSGLNTYGLRLLYSELSKLKTTCRNEVKQ